MIDIKLTRALYKYEVACYALFVRITDYKNSKRVRISDFNFKIGLSMHQRIHPNFFVKQRNPISYPEGPQRA